MVNGQLSMKRGSASPAARIDHTRRGESGRINRCSHRQIYRSQFQVGQELLDLGWGYITLVVLGVEVAGVVSIWELQARGTADSSQDTRVLYHSLHGVDAHRPRRHRFS